MADDVVNCGDNLITGSGNPDNDHVRYDPGGQIADNCETRTPLNP